MGDKFLSAVEWKKFAKGREVKDAGFLKSLTDLDNAKGADAELKALAAIRKEAETLRKAAKSDKEFNAYLESVDKAIAKQEKAAKDAAKESEEVEGEGDSFDLLTTKMIPLLRQVKKGDEMQVMLASTGKQVAVLMSRRPITPTRRKLLSDYLEGATPKYFLGTCILEEDAHTFVLQAPSAGLAKKIKAALLKQTELRFKVRVRGEDGVDDDGEEAVDESRTGDASGASGPGAQDPMKSQFEKEWATLEVRALAALRAGQGEASKIRAVAEFVQQKGAAGNYKAALQAIEALKKLLGAVSPAPGASAESAAAEQQELSASIAKLTPLIRQTIADNPARRGEIMAAVAALQGHMTAREFDRAKAALLQIDGMLQPAKNGAGGASAGTVKPARTPTRPLAPIWEQASERAIDQVTALILALRKLGDPEFDRMADDLLDAVTGHLADLGDVLEDYDGASPQERDGLAADALEFVQEHQREVDDDPLIKAADSNPLGVRVSLATTLGAAFDEIAAAFQG